MCIRDRHYKETLAGNDIKMGTGYPERLMEALDVYKRQLFALAGYQRI